MVFASSHMFAGVRSRKYALTHTLCDVRVLCNMYKCVCADIRARNTYLMKLAVNFSGNHRPLRRKTRSCDHAPLIEWIYDSVRWLRAARHARMHIHLRSQRETLRARSIKRRARESVHIISCVTCARFLRYVCKRCKCYEYIARVRI